MEALWEKWRNCIVADGRLFVASLSYPLQNSRSIGRKTDLIQEIAVEAASRESAKYFKIPRHFEDGWSR
jgi:hypothetical protein